MEQHLTKCCNAKYYTVREDGYVYLRCSHCHQYDPELEEVEMCEYCKKPAMACDCP